MERGRARGGKRKSSSSETVEKTCSKRIKKQESSEIINNTKENKASTSQIKSKEVPKQWTNEFLSEIFSFIFSYLPLRDRNNARLVCRSLFDASNKERILMKETLLCDGDENVDIGAVIQTFENSQRVILNLTFMGINFNDASWCPEFWTKCGPKIRSLELGRCIFSDEVLKVIIQHCNQLEKLSLKQNRPLSEGKLIRRTGTCLDELIALKVCRESLEYFEIRGFEKLSNNFLRAIFTIYPNIKHLFYSVHLFDEFFESSSAMDDATLCSTEKCTFAIILKKLKDSQNTLESFEFGDAWIQDEWASKFWKILKTLQFPNLKKICVLFEMEGISEDYWLAIDFFAKHKKLKTIEWWLPIHATHLFINNMMNSLLKNCRCLKSLHLLRSFEPEAPVTTNSDVFTKLVNSKLESLTISFGIDMKGRKRTARNQNLRTLCITDVPVDAFKGIEPEEFFRNFCGLTKLDVDIPSWIDDRALQSIIKYQPNLVNLKLYSENLTDYGFTGVSGEGDDPSLPKGSSIQKLNKLEFLSLLMDEDNWEITDKTLAVLKFPNLKYLDVKIPDKFKYTKTFLQLIPTYPELEVLSLDMAKETIDRAKCVELLSKMKWLIDFYISFKKFENFDEEIYKSLFECCPSLRFLKYKSKGSERRSYYYDVVTRNIVYMTETDGTDDDDDDDDEASESSLDATGNGDTGDEGSDNGNSENLEDLE